MLPTVHLMVVRNSVPIGLLPGRGLHFPPDSDLQEEIKKRSKKLVDPEIQPINFECYVITYDALFNLLKSDQFIREGSENNCLRRELRGILWHFSNETKKIGRNNKFQPTDKFYFCFG